MLRVYRSVSARIPCMVRMPCSRVRRSRRAMAPSRPTAAADEVHDEVADGDDYSCDCVYDGDEYLYERGSQNCAQA